MQKYKRMIGSMCCAVAIVLLFVAAGQMIVGNVAAKYAKDVTFSAVVTVPRNYYTVTYYDSDGVTALNNTDIRLLYGNGYTVVDTYNAQVTVPDEATFKEWVNAGGQTVTTISSDNKEDIELYPTFDNLYTARFMDMTGQTLLASVTFNTSTTAAHLAAQAPDIPLEDGDCTFNEWQVRNSDGTYTSLSSYNPKNATGDIVVIPNYTYSGTLNLKPIDEDGDGDVDYYQVEAVAQLDDKVTIPGYVGSVPVKVVTDLTSSNWASNVTSIEVQEGVTRIEAGAFADTPELKTVSLPSTLEYLGESAFVDDGWVGDFGGFLNYKTPAITYNGTKEEWDTLIQNSHDNWDNNLGAGTTIRCTDGVYKLTQSGLSKKWVWTANS